MAQIAASSGVSILQIKEFLGLNENPDGDTNIRVGELSEMRNFRITSDKHLQIRPGTKTILQLKAAWDTWAGSHETEITDPVFCGAWYGMAGTAEHLLCAFGGVVFDVNPISLAVKAVGECTEAPTSFFGFDQKVYLLNGHEYMSWDGGEETSFTAVVGYIPTVQTATTPEGAGTLLENVNRLNGFRRVEYSPDGEATVFHLPEQDVDDIVSVDGTEITYTEDLTAGTLTFASAPTKGTNSITVTYQKGTGARSEVEGMTHSELYNGATDTRVFLYGDGSNKTIYSGINGDTGQPSAEYFPDLYEAAIGESNTPITSLVRHYARLLAFKPGSAWSIQYNTMTLDTGAVTSAFYILPVNRLLGNAAMGQVRLVENSPLSVDGSAIYQWRSTSTSGNITASEQNAKRVSDRVRTTLESFDLKNVVTFNSRERQEFWFLYGGTALILNYANDSWYVYTNMPFSQMLEVEGDVLGFTADGKMVRLSREYRNDDGEEIDAYVATGAMDFSRDWQLKYSPMIFVAMEPEVNARITVTVESNRRSDYPEKVVAYSYATFSHADFRHWSFRTNRKPQVKRVKMKVKKATFYKLIYKSLSASATATVLGTDVQIRYAGNVK